MRAEMSRGARRPTPLTAGRFIGFCEAVFLWSLHANTDAGD